MNLEEECDEHFTKFTVSITFERMKQTKKLLSIKYREFHKIRAHSDFVPVSLTAFHRTQEFTEIDGIPPLRINQFIERYLPLSLLSH
jgi:hypothetical protein